jgi:hypothetical protein
MKSRARAEPFAPSCAASLLLASVARRMHTCVNVSVMSLFVALSLSYTHTHTHSLGAREPKVQRGEVSVQGKAFTRLCRAPTPPNALTLNS